MRAKQLFSAGVLGISVLAGVGGGEALSAKNIACVDMKQVYDTSPAPALVDQQDKQLIVQMRDKELKLTQLKYLDTQDIISYYKLIMNPAPTPDQLKQIAALEQKGNQRTTQMSAYLNSQAPLSISDKTLETQYQDNSQQLEVNILPQIDKDMRAQENQQVLQFQDDQMKSLWKIVGDVAKQHHVSEVWDQKSLIYSDEDITKDVIQYIKKQK